MFCSNCGNEVTGNFCSNCGAKLENKPECKAEEVDINCSDIKRVYSINDERIINVNGVNVDVNKVIKIYGSKLRKFGAYSWLVLNTGISNKEAHSILDPIYEEYGDSANVSFSEAAKAQVALDKERKAGLSKDFNRVAINKSNSESENKKIKVCSCCGDKLLEKAKRCPTCGAKENALILVDAENKSEIEKIIYNAQYSYMKEQPLWEKKVDDKLSLYKPSKKALEKQKVKELKEDKVPYCPKCHSTHLTANKKGYGIGKGVAGALVGTALEGPVGWIGLTAGNLGAKKIRVTCLNCGHQFYL